MSDTASRRRSGANETSRAPGNPFSVLFGGGRFLNTTLLWAGFAFTLVVLYLLLNWLPSLLVSRGFSKPQSAEMQILFNLGGVVGSAVAGWLIDGRRRLAVTVCSFLLTPLALFALAAGSSSTSIELVIGAVLGVAIMSNQAILYAMAPWCYPDEVRGFGVGAAVSVGRLGSLMGPLLAGELVGAGQSAAQVLMHMLPIVAVGGFAAIALSVRPLQRALTGGGAHSADSTL
jgi:AAHS family 3-hydroxyphenylpropionic acid transporter